MSSVRTPALRLLTTRALALLGFGLAVDLSPAAASAAQPALRAPKAGDEGPLAGAKPAAKKGKGKGKAEPARPAGAGAAPPPAGRRPCLRRQAGRRPGGRRGRRQAPPRARRQARQRQAGQRQAGREAPDG